MIRQATAEDIPRLLEIAHVAYPAMFDHHSSELWLRRAVDLPTVRIFIGDRSAGVVSLSRPFYAPQTTRAGMLFLASEGRAGYEPCSVLRKMIEWSREMQAVSFHFGESTGVDLSLLAKRVGAKTDTDAYVMKL